MPDTTCSRCATTRAGFERAPFPGAIQQFLLGNDFQGPARERHEHVDHLRPKPPVRALTRNDPGGRVDAPVANLQDAG